MYIYARRKIERSKEGVESGQIPGFAKPLQLCISVVRCFKIIGFRRDYFEFVVLQAAWNQ